MLAAKTPTNFNNEQMFVVEKRLKPVVSIDSQIIKSVQCEPVNTSHGMIGRSKAMQTVFSIVETVAKVPSGVLITGESGTGKDLVARAIHNLSARAQHAFISVNCGAISESLLESELFGYVKGAFTGATSNRKGLFEAAHKGTIFLDEIGEMSASMQVKLLRVLQEKKVRPVGANKEISIDTRVIAATNKDLNLQIKDGSFREDLFYRIAVIPISLPPLRDRREDVQELARHFATKFGNQINKNLQISASALRFLENYSWPGNVRELENVIEHAATFEQTGEIQPARLPEKVTQYNWVQINDDLNLPVEGIALLQHLELLEKEYLLAALQRTKGNQTEAAELLQMSVRILRHLLDKHKLRSIVATLKPQSQKVRERCLTCQRTKYRV